MAARRRSATLWATAAVAILGSVLWDLYPLPPATKRLDDIPKRGPGFFSRKVPLTPAERAVLGPVGIVHREYRWHDHDFYLSVIDGTRNRHAVHDPSYCFRGAGWNILSRKEIHLPGGKATWFRITRSGREAEAVFWFSDGLVRYPSVFTYWWETALRRLTLGHSGPEPVLVVLQAYGREPPDWGPLLRQLIPDLRL
jgi:Protein of unknown function (DUF3485)